MAEANLLESVETRIAEALARNVSLMAARSDLPFAVIHLDHFDTESPSVHLFHVPQNRKIYDMDMAGKPKFCAVLENGSFVIYDTMFRTAIWKRQCVLKMMNWGTMLWREDPDPLLMLNSREDAYFEFRPIREIQANLSLKVPLTRDAHNGFCKPFLCSDGDVIVPIKLDQIGIQTPSRKRAPAFHRFESTLMAITEVKCEGEVKHIICCTEAGYIELLEIQKVQIDIDDEDIAPFACEVISKLFIPKGKKGKGQPIATCLEGDGSCFAVGTVSKVIYVVKLSDEKPYKLVPYGKKILPTEGISCLALKKDSDRKLLAAGCFDGSVRIYEFPNMNQISTIDYHKVYINSLLFIDDDDGKKKRSFLVFGLSTPFLTIWEVPEKEKPTTPTPLTQEKQEPSTSKQ